MINKDKIIEQLRQENQQLHETVHFLHSKMGALLKKPAQSKNTSQHPSTPSLLAEEHPFCAAGATEQPSEEEQYDSRNVRLLVRICYELQQIQGSDPFRLSCRNAGALLGMSHTQTARYIHKLVVDGILKVVEEHTRNRATRYKYIEI